MSLPPAQKEISVHPTQTSVTDPVNTAVANHDVDRKVPIMQLVYFIFERSSLLDYVIWRGRGF